MTRKVRFLLTSKCTATCGYCHNEGQSSQGKSLLAVSEIERILNRLDQGNCLPEEIVLSGGEPTLHKNLREIAALCKATGCRVSLNSHGGHPELLQPALPFIDELKLHIDSFEAHEQRRSMGLDMHKVDASIRAAHDRPHIRLIANHPLIEIQRTALFVAAARARNIDCKIIQAFGNGFALCIDWEHYGYVLCDESTWAYRDGQHHLFTKFCCTEHNTEDPACFIGADGVRLTLDGPIISAVTDFDPLHWLRKENME